MDAMGYSYWAPASETKGVMAMVKEFAKVTKQQPNSETSARLIREEFSEWQFENRGTNNDLKELADLIYVVYGYANVMGYDLDEAVRRVHLNNLERVVQPDGTVKFREDGKVLKRENAPKVDLSDLVK
jgi:hypothetical protein